MKESRADDSFFTLMPNSLSSITTISSASKATTDWPCRFATQSLPSASKARPDGVLSDMSTEPSATAGSGAPDVAIDIAYVGNKSDGLLLFANYNQAVPNNSAGTIPLSIVCLSLVTIGQVGFALHHIRWLWTYVVLVHVVNPQSFHWTMDLLVPWARLLALCAAVIVAGTVTAWLAGRAAAGRDAVLAVKEDW